MNLIFLVFITYNYAVFLIENKMKQKNLISFLI